MEVCAAPPFAIDGTLPDDTRWRAHDLLRLRTLAQFDGEPSWVRDAFARAPFAVVRRALAAAGYVAIGIRGKERSQRYGTWAALSEMESATSPEALLSCEPDHSRMLLPAFAALLSLRRHTPVQLETLRWGPTGSTGFELATRVWTVTESSDLDLLIRTPAAMSHHEAAQILQHLQAVAESTGVRVDAQLETPAGGVALVEWAAGTTRVMARHARGPQRVADPWACAHGTL
ncbi:MAG TPA: malonate decarboxylase holo-ACP synthase [Paraburkholderia sp.]|jgi:phosphoribosyl-dephospho-CoA transferase|nr:malonate decarboxylase holo-ACP synthase [Paraburkholderia sp.]